MDSIMSELGVLSGVAKGAQLLFLSDLKGSLPSLEETEVSNSSPVQAPGAGLLQSATTTQWHPWAPWVFKGHPF